MSDGVMTYEDWLRGCVHHDGRHGYVTLPCDEVLKIADFIERLRADRKDEPQFDKDINVRSKDEPQTEYERASEQREHDILYEPTYNKDDGSM